MKKIYLFLLALCACFIQMYAETVKLNGLYYSLGTTTAQVVKDQSSDNSVYKDYTAVTIPASVTYNNYTYPVTSIGTSAFEGLTNLQSVTLPTSVTTIGTDAFYGCTKLGSVNLEEGLTTINLRAFYNCNLTEITIPSTVTSIGNSAFKENPTTTIVWKPADCSIGSDDSAPFYSTNSQVTSFTFADGVEVVPAYICKNMNKIDTIVLPASVSRLGQYAFMNCTNLKSINLPATQKTLPASFLEGCTSLESIELPATLTTVSADAFYGCTKLANVNLHEGITTIGLRAFYNCKLTEITIPSTVTSIGNAAFKENPTTTIVWKPADCSIGSDDSAPFYSTNSQVTSFTFADGVEVVPAYICKNMNKIDTIVLPASVNRLGQYAFMNCTNLKSINLPATQKTLPASFLEGCTSLESIELPATLTTVSADAFYGCTKLANVNLHEGITTIGLRAFYNCKLTEITIPSTVTSIGNAAFKENPTTTIVWKPADCSIGSDDSAPFYSTNSQVTSFTFADGVQVIPAYLCKYMKIETIAIPATVTSVGQSAFMYCTNLKHFEFPQGIKTVATSVLEGCTALEEVVIPSSVTTINQDAFYNCSALQAIRNYAYTPQTITERTVNNVNKQTCILYVPMDYIDLYQAKAVWCDFINIIGVATDLQFEEQTVQVSYLKQDESLHYMEAQKWQVPHAPRIEGFTFLKWQVLPGDLAEGIVLQAVYEANNPTEAPAVYTNPANHAQKLIKNGNVYILSGEKVYTVTGQELK